ncbi:MAG: hypothetical protein QOF24_1397 [Verrucomicrobiota bacterium]|jgi:hypothetical protein
MNPLWPEDLALFHRIRGRFRTTKGHRIGARAAGIFLCILLPSVFVYALFERGWPRWPLTADEWTCVILLILTPAMGSFVWLSADREWEFTGEEILMRRRGRLLWKIPVDSITATRIQRVRHAIGSISLRADAVIRFLSSLIYSSASPTKPNQTMQREDRAQATAFNVSWA